MKPYTGALQQEPDIDFAAEAVPLTPAQTSIWDPLQSGFLWYQPPLASEKEHKTGGHSWNIAGHDMQILTISVPAGEQAVTEVGSFMYMSPFMETKVELTLCSAEGGCQAGCNRICGGESCVKVYLTNPSSQEGYVGLTPNYPAKVIPIKFGTHVKSGSKLIAYPGVYMSELGDVDVGCDLDCSPTTCCCGGLGCCRQKIEGTDDSIAFLAAGGTLVYKHLEAGEQIVVDTHSIVAIEETVELGITPNGRCCSLTCCCGGEGIFSTTLTGPGRVYMQSFSYQKFLSSIAAAMDRGDGGAGAGGGGGDGGGGG